MSTHQNEDAKSQGSRKNGKIHSAIEKAQAIQQREQLRQMITDKFNKDFSRGNLKIKKIIEDIIAEYFGKEKITEDSLRVLKQNVSKAVEEYRKNSQSCNYLYKSRKSTFIKIKVSDFQTINC